MSIFSTLRRRWRAIVRRSRVNSEVEEELQFHLAAYTDELIRKGLPEETAQRQARIDFGGASVQGERYREAIGLRAWDECWNDLRYGLRGLRRKPAFAAVTILSLALSIGMATAMFSLVHAVMLDVYPYADSDRTVNPIVFDPAHPDDWDWFFLDRKEYSVYRSSPVFEDVFGQVNLGAQMEEPDGVEQINLVALTANAEEFLRVKPLIGRGLRASDGDYGDPSPDVVVLNYRFWLKHFGGDASVLGRKIKFSVGLPAQTQTVTIVGVMPERFTLGSNTSGYIPMSQMRLPDARMIAFGKLKRGITAQMASAAVDRMVHDFAAQEPRMYPKTFQTRLQPLINGFTDRSKFVRSLPILFIAVGTLLLIGCANCSILLLARGATRTHEFALRAAIGASPFRLVRQLLVECLAISLLGSFLGIGLSYFLARLPLLLAKDLFPTESVIRVDLSVLLFSVALAMLVGLLFGLWPAVRFSRPQITQTLQKSSRRTGSSKGHASLRRLIGGQIALTLVLLTLAVAAVAGFVRLVRLHLGYNPSNVTFAFGAFGPGKKVTWAEAIARNEKLRNAIAAVPGVNAAAFGDNFPPSGGSRAFPFEIVGDPAHTESTSLRAFVSPEYFSILQIPVLHGRTWTDAEGRQGLPLAVVNKTFEHRYSPDRSILNRTLRFSDLDPKAFAHDTPHSPAFTSPEFLVVGVVGDTINDGLGKPVLPNVYVDLNIFGLGGAPMMVRTQGDPAQYTAALRHALHNAGAGIIYISDFSLDEMLHNDETWRRQRLTAALFSLFAAAALLLALVGLYSVVEYLVAQRTQEFGIRMALGATRPHILWLVLRSNLTVILAGTVLGAVVSVVVRRESVRWLEDSAQNPLLLAGTAVLLAVVAAAACLSPALRAARVNLNEVLHTE